MGHLHIYTPQWITRTHFFFLTYNEPRFHKGIQKLFMKWDFFILHFFSFNELEVSFYGLMFLFIDIYSYYKGDKTKKFYDRACRIDTQLIRAVTPEGSQVTVINISELDSGLKRNSVFLITWLTLFLSPWPKLFQ